MDRLLSLLLLEVDASLRADGPPLLLLAATSDRGRLDPAILRPGRLDVHVQLRHPDEEQRARLLASMLASTPVQWGEAGGEAEDASLAWLAQLSSGYSVAQLSALCREAAMGALRESLSAGTVRKRHFAHAASVIA